MVYILSISSEIVLMRIPQGNIGSSNVRAARQQANTWANVDQFLWCHVASLRDNELKYFVESITYSAPQRLVFNIWIMVSFYMQAIDRHMLSYLVDLNTRIAVCHFNSLWHSDTIWRQRSGSTLAHVMACCLTAPIHYLNQCWLLIIDYSSLTAPIHYLNQCWLLQCHSY